MNISDKEDRKIKIKKKKKKEKENSPHQETKRETNFKK